MVETKNSLKKVCFIGLGVMGSRISKIIARKNFNIVLYDICPSTRNEFREQGDNTPEEISVAAKDADMVMMILPTSKIVNDAIFGLNEIGKSVVESVQKNCLFVDMTTGSLSDLFILNENLTNLGHRLIDAPVGRSPREAKVGKSLVMAGGNNNDVAQAKPVFDAFADSVVHVGAVGDGLRLKLVNNYMAMINHVLTGEVLSFAKSTGLDRDVAVSVLSSTSAGRGQLLTNFPKKVLADDTSPDFSIRMGIKDLNMALELASNSNFDPKFGELSLAMFSKAAEAGMGDQDCTAILNYFDKINK
jgi:4-hydroxybutyrate dehydrogenase/sulfolactaldehyde 3-reductase